MKLNLSELLQTNNVDWMLKRIDDSVISTISNVEKGNPSHDTKVAHAMRNKGKFCLMLVVTEKVRIFGTETMIDYYRDKETGLLMVVEDNDKAIDDARSLANIETGNLYRNVG